MAQDREVADGRDAEVTTQGAQAAVTTAARDGHPRTEPASGQGRAVEPAPVRDEAAQRARSEYEREFVRAENEDDDGYDPYSDRRPVAEPLFERDPWA